MKVKGLWSYCGSMVISAFLAAFSGAALAGPGTALLSDSVVPISQRDVQAAGDQDPNTPPDCKKYPSDTRCKK